MATAQVENVVVPPPFSWVVRVFDFATLQPLTALFFSPCAFVSYQTTLVFVTLVPFLLFPACQFFSFLCALGRGAKRLRGDWHAAAKDWRGALRESFYSGCHNYIVLALMVHTTVCVSIFDHFNCKGPYHVGSGRTKRVLAQDFETSCESPAYEVRRGVIESGAAATRRGRRVDDVASTRRRRRIDDAASMRQRRRVDDAASMRQRRRIDDAASTRRRRRDAAATPPRRRRRRAGVGRLTLNYEKFLLDGDGKPLRRYPRKFTPYDFEADVAAAVEGRPLAAPTAAFKDAWVKADQDAKKGEYSFRAQYNVWDQSEPSRDWDGLAELSFT